MQERELQTSKGMERYHYSQIQGYSDEPEQGGILTFEMVRQCIMGEGAGAF